MTSGMLFVGKRTSVKTGSKPCWKHKKPSRNSSPRFETSRTRQKNRKKWYLSLATLYIALKHPRICFSKKNRFFATGEGNYTRHQTIGSRKEAFDQFHNNPESPSHVGGRRGLIVVNYPFVKTRLNFWENTHECGITWGEIITNVFLLQCADKKATVWRGGQLAGRCYQRPWQFPQVHEHSTDCSAGWQVSASGCLFGFVFPVEKRTWDGSKKKTDRREGLVILFDIQAHKRGK